MFVYTHFQAPVFISVKISHVSEMITRRLSQSFTKLRRLSLMTQPTRQIDVEDEDTQVNNTHTMPSPAAMGLSEVNSLDYVSSDNDAARQAQESSISVPEISMNYMESDIIEEAQDLSGLSSIQLPSDVSSMHIPSCFSTSHYVGEHDMEK